MSHYNQFLEVLTKLNFEDRRHYIIYGPSEYLMLKATRAIEQKFVQKTQGTIERLGANDLNEELWAGLVGQEDLFADSKLCTIRAGEKKLRAYWEDLALINPEKLQSKCFVFVREDPLDLQLKLDARAALSFTKVPCVLPEKQALGQLVYGIALRLGLRLSDDSVRYLMPLAERDFLRLESELERMSLIFGANDTRTVGLTELKAELSLTKQDLVFKLEDMILSERWGEALELVLGLIDRGENPGAILGFLAMHARRYLAFLDLNQLEQWPAGMRKPPPFLARNYSRGAGQGAFHTAKLRAFSGLCTRADLDLKSGCTAPDLLLTKLLLDYQSLVRGS